MLIIFKNTYVTNWVNFNWFKVLLGVMANKTYSALPKSTSNGAALVDAI